MTQQHLPLDCHAGLAAEKPGELFVAVTEGTAALVEHLQHAHNPAIVVGQGHGEQVAGAEAAAAVELGIETRVGIGVGQIHDAAAAGHLPGDP